MSKSEEEEQGKSVVRHHLNLGDVGLKLTAFFFAFGAISQLRQTSLGLRRLNPMQSFICFSTCRCRKSNKCTGICLWRELSQYIC